MLTKQMYCVITQVQIYIYLIQYTYYRYIAVLVVNALVLYLCVQPNHFSNAHLKIKLKELEVFQLCAGRLISQYSTLRTTPIYIQLENQVYWLADFSHQWHEHNNTMCLTIIHFKSLFIFFSVVKKVSKCAPTSIHVSACYLYNNVNLRHTYN